MKINIISRDNAAGLTAETEIMTKLFENQGWEVFFSDYKSLDRFMFWSYKKYDVNIFMQWANPTWLKLAKYNILIPNPEWFKVKWSSNIEKFDRIFCKTKSAVELFKMKNENTVYTGFTSKNRLIREIKKEPGQWLHVAGKSKLKGTNVIIETWLRNPNFPHLTILQKNSDGNIPSAPNITYISKHISEGDLTELMNKCEVHLCPSVAEGFGHYIGEAMSCGAFVITTDAPPMNELVSETRGALVPFVEKSKMKFSYAYYIDSLGLEEVVNKVANMDIINEHMKNALEYYNSSGEAFRVKIVSEINELVDN